MAEPVAPKVVVTVSPGEMRSNFKGAYSAERTYTPGQWVSEEGGLYTCTQETEGNTPKAGSEYWALIGALPE
jgi:hypothetical protein